MSPSGNDFNIFKLSSASLDEIMSCFRGFSSLSFPAAEKKPRGFTLRTVQTVERDGSPCFPVLTDPGISAGPCLTMPVKEALSRLFYAPAAENAVFNPEGPLVKEPGPEVKLDRMKLSLILGFLDTPGEPADLQKAAAGALAAGEFHKANYLFYRIFEREGPDKIMALYPQVLMELGQHRQAYFMLKDIAAPEAWCNLAFIYFETGDIPHAAEFLARVPAGTALEDRRTLLSALLKASAGGPGFQDPLRAMIPGPLAPEASCGLAAVLYRSAPGDRVVLDEARTMASSAAAHPRTAFKALSLLGSIKFSLGDFREAEEHWAKAFTLAPMPALLANAGAALISLRAYGEALSAAADLSPWDLPAAEKIVAAVPDEAVAAGTAPRKAAAPAPSAAAPAKTPRQAAGFGEKESVFDYFDAMKKEPAPEARPAASLERADISSRAPTVSRRTQQSPAPQPEAAAPAKPPAAAAKDERASDVQFEDYGELFESAVSTKPEQARADDFMGRAFRLASSLEEETGRKIYFSLEGIAEVEKKLRITFIKSDRDPVETTEIVLSAAAFLSYFFQERHRARLLKFPDFDPWGWPLVMPGSDFLTYPVQRVWRLLWNEPLPEPGWLTRYAQWAESEIRSPSEKVTGADAVKRRVRSHPERVTDAETEHRRMIVLASTLSETAGIETARTGAAKIGQALKARFKPDIPPTSDGWKLLRCYGHLFASILIKDFKGVWHNTDGNDGLWSLRFPWNTYAFPLGKVYKAASTGEDLLAYYDKLMEDKLKPAGL
ncbi:MAG: tetratricopeptide repeat protein [Elusimicrobiales bacterium]|nr:tetratricopeptide repeat protein [Elusimicrobiales bacterium]